MIPGNTASQGKKPTTPTIGTATGGNAQATVSFTESTYRGKSDSGTYRATSSPGSITGTCSAPCTSITVTGLSNGTAYTFTVTLETPYGINSESSASSNSVTPVAPPPDFPVSPDFPVTPPPVPVGPCFASPCTPSCSAVTSSTTNNGPGNCCSCPGGVAGQCRTTTTTYSGNTGSCTNACGEVTNCSGPPAPTSGCNFALACY